MSLYISDVPVSSLAKAEDASILEAILTHDFIVEGALKFKELPVKNVAHSANQKVVCVLQREYATVKTSTVDIVGSDDATTCLIVFMSLGKSVVACSHLDGSDDQIAGPACAIQKLAKSCEELARDEVSAEEPFCVWITGGFTDEYKTSLRSCGLVFASLNSCKRRVDLKLACVERWNTTPGKDDVPFPVFMGSAFDCKEGQVVPAHWTSLGPAVGLRSALPCCGPTDVQSCYDAESDEICIYFEYGEFELAAQLLQTDDDFLRDNISSSGPQEPDRFFDTMRKALKFLVDNPNYKAFFQGGKPIRFKRSELGAWLKK